MSKESSETSFTKGLPDGGVVSYVESEFIAVVLFLHLLLQDFIPKERAEALYEKFVAFEKRYGGKEGIEDALVGKKRFEYEDEVRKNPLNYDSWFDYLRLEEEEGFTGNKDRIREIYERAVANVPPAEEKRFWINYALYEETETKDVERARDVYRIALLGEAMLSLRCLSENDRTRAIFELAISQPALDMPELLWKTYIDFEISEKELERTRALYERLLDRTKHYKVWVSFAKFEASATEHKGEGDKEEVAIETKKRLHQTR
ncbi:hypothetical protein Bca4012_080065 [Brassica carinata]